MNTSDLDPAARPTFGPMLAYSRTRGFRPRLGFAGESCVNEDREEKKP